jgi:hypothetical protein
MEALDASEAVDYHPKQAFQLTFVNESSSLISVPKNK